MTTEDFECRAPGHAGCTKEYRKDGLWFTHRPSESGFQRNGFGGVVTDTATPPADDVRGVCDQCGNTLDEHYCAPVPSCIHLPVAEADREALIAVFERTPAAEPGPEDEHHAAPGAYHRMWEEHMADAILNAGFSRRHSEAVSAHTDPSGSTDTAEKCRACFADETGDRTVHVAEDIPLCGRHWSQWVARYIWPSEAEPPCSAHLIEFEVRPRGTVTPPADDVREAVDHAVRAALSPLGIDYVPWYKLVDAVRDSLLAEPTLEVRPRGTVTDAANERAAILADLREWSRPLGNSPEEDTLRLVIARIEARS